VESPTTPSTGAMNPPYSGFAKGIDVSAKSAPMVSSSGANAYTGKIAALPTNKIANTRANTLFSILMIFTSEFFVLIFFSEQKVPREDPHTAQKFPLNKRDPKKYT
jgi:hypothetical protein